MIEKSLVSAMIYVVCIIGIIVLVGISIIANEGNVKCDCNCQEKR